MTNEIQLDTSRIRWKIHTKVIEDGGENVIELSWGWTAGMTEEELENYAEDAPRGHESVLITSDQVVDLIDNLICAEEQILEMSQDSTHYCLNCQKTLSVIDEDPNGDMGVKCAKCLAEENHDWDLEPNVEFDRWCYWYDKYSNGNQVEKMKKYNDNAEYLSTVLYGEDSAKTVGKLLGGSNAPILKDAAEEIERLKSLLKDKENLEDSYSKTVTNGVRITDNLNRKAESANKLIKTLSDTIDEYLDKKETD